jgi:hypothetical protein
LVFKYVHIFCFTMFFTGSVNCEQLELHNHRENEEFFQISLCMARCMKAANEVTSIVEYKIEKTFTKIRIPLCSRA